MLRYGGCCQSYGKQLLRCFGWFLGGNLLEQVKKVQPQASMIFLSNNDRDVSFKKGMEALQQ